VINTVLAAFWDTGTSEFDAGDLGIVLGVLISIGVIVSGTLAVSLRILRWVIRQELEHYTKPIQPTSNGSKSLPDVARSAKRAELIGEALAAAMGVQIPDVDQVLLKEHQ